MQPICPDCLLKQYVSKSGGKIQSPLVPTTHHKNRIGLHNQLEYKKKELLLATKTTERASGIMARLLRRVDNHFAGTYPWKEQEEARKFLVEMESCDCDHCVFYHHSAVDEPDLQHGCDAPGHPDVYDVLQGEVKPCRHFKPTWIYDCPYCCAAPGKVGWDFDQEKYFCGACGERWEV